MSEGPLDDRRCRARSKRTGERCRRFPAPGGVVCHFHGGATKAAKAAAARRVAEVAAADLLAVIWNPDAAPVEDNVLAMKRLAGQLTHAVDVLGGRLGADDLDGATSIAWGKVLRELRQLLVAMERLGIEQRYVELQQAQAAIVVAAFRAGMDTIGSELLPATRDAATRAFLAALGVGPEPPERPGVVVVGELG